MKTTIEVLGYEIVIKEEEGVVTVEAIKEGETVEEFSLSSEEEVKSFDGEDDDFDGEEEGEEEGEDFDGEEDDDFDGEEDGEGFGEEEDDFDGEEEEVEMSDDEKSPKLESFDMFVKKLKK